MDDTYLMAKEKLMSRVLFDKETGCWIWKSNNKFRYGYIRINMKAYRVNRLAWEVFRGEIPNGLWVLHHCDNTKCINPDHLFLGTQTDNMIDMTIKGRHPRKFNEKIVRKVRKLYATEKYSYISLGELLGISATHIGQIVRKDRWGWLE